ncbi:MAG: c-type cytochrome [Candidatus Rokuibacteriota bacterium]
MACPISLRRLIALACLAGLPGTSAEARQGKTLAEIRRTGSLTACADPENMPFSQRGDPPGYDIEVLRAVATGLGVRLEVEWIGTERARVALRRLTEGDCDLFPGLPLAPGFAEEYPRLVFSEAYYTMSHVLVTRKGTVIRGLDDLAGLTTAVEKLSHGDLFLLAKGYRRRAYRTQQAAFQAVATGESAALLWAPVAGWLAARGSSGWELSPVSHPDLEVAVSIGMRRDDPDLRVAVDGAVLRLRQEGVIRAILGRYGVPVRAAARRPASRPAPGIPVAFADGPGPAGTWDPDIVDGRHIYESACSSCHGPDGLGRGVVPTLQAYPQGADVRFIKAVLEGRPGAGMPPWSGLLSESQIRQVLKYVRALVPPPEVVTAAGTAQGAGQVFQAICASCHGAGAAGTAIAPGLLAFRGDDDAFVGTVLNGRSGTPMAPFRSMLSADTVLRIRAYLRELGARR